MDFGIDRRARAKKPRGWFAKAPTAEEVGNRLVRLAKRTFGDAVAKATASRVALKLHKYAPRVTIDVLPDAELHVRGSTLEVGPGYHDRVIAQLAPLLEELDYAWASTELGDDPDSLPAIQAATSEYVADALSTGATAFGMPKQRTFLVPGMIQTPLGPRDAAWRAAVIADPEHVADAFAWWDGLTPAHATRARALLALWHDAPPRAPLDDAERELLDRIDDDLAAAAAAGLDVPDREHFAGYRAHPLEIEVSDWSLALPGTFVTHVEEDDRWWATDGERVVELTAFTANDASQSSSDLLALAPELHTVIANEAENDRLARAESHTTDGVTVVIGLVAQAPQVCILTCRSRLASPDWALALWRSLSPTA